MCMLAGSFNLICACPKIQLPSPSPGLAAPPCPRPKAMDAPRSQRIEFLDSVRGLAALAVLFGHAGGALVNPPVLQTLFASPLMLPLVDGKAAVAMFFVLSGFVLARPYVKPTDGARPRQIRLVPFYIKRITRIYFPFFCVLTLSALASLYLFKRVETIPPQSEWFKHFWSMPWTALDFLKQCFFMLHVAQKQLIVQDWSLGVELKASAMLPFLVLALRRNVWLLALIGGLFLGFLFTGHYYCGFIFGIFLAARGELLLAKLRRQNFAVKCALLLTGLLLYDSRNLVTFSTAPKLNEKLTWIAVSVGCVLILLACFSSNRMQKALQHKTVVFLGRISYGVYLLQLLVLLVVTPWFVQQLNRAGFQSPLPVWCAAFLVSVGLTILGGAIFFQLVEKPSMQFGHALAAKYDPKPAPIAAPATPAVTREP
jgi:peptidoglycan/LPS O-acetylase OafA/YrhL